MTDDANALPSRRPGRSLLRRWVYPVAVILAIVAVIWFIEHRNSDNTSPVTGQAFGVRELDSHFNPDGLSVEADEGAMAPDFELEKVGIDASGNGSVSGESWLSDYRGHPVVLNFWATWCEPCRKEAPQFVNAYDKYKSQGLVVIGLDQQEGAGTIAPFAQQYGMDYPLLIDRDGEVGQKYRLLGLPTTFFIDSNGIIQKIFRGESSSSSDGISQSDLDAGLATIMQTASPTGAASGSG